MKPTQRLVKYPGAAAVAAALVLVTACLEAALAWGQAPAGEEAAPVEAAPLEARDVAPIRAAFNTSNPPRLNEPVEVVLEVLTRPGVELPPIREGAELEILLRLPVGVKLASEGWKPVEPSAQDTEDPTGPWSLYGWKRPLALAARLGSASSEGDQRLDQMPIRLTVAEEGVNWIITARVRVIQGQEAWQTFAATFATVEYGVTRFSPIPLTSLPAPEEPL